MESSSFFNTEISYPQEINQIATLLNFPVEQLILKTASKGLNLFLDHCKNHLKEPSGETSLFIQHISKILSNLGIQIKDKSSFISKNQLTLIFSQRAKKQKHLKKAFEIFRTLYPEMKISIFYLSHEKPSLALLQSIGKEFSLLNLSFTEKDFEENDSVKTLAPFSQYCTNLTALLLDVNDSTINLNLKKFNKLISLDLLATDLLSFDLPDQLKNLHLGVKNISEINQPLPNLKTLNLSTPKLKKITLFPNSLKILQISSAKLTELPRLPHRLKVLSILECKKLRVKNLWCENKERENSPPKDTGIPQNLEILSIRGCSKIKAEEKWSILAQEKNPPLKRALLLLRGFDQPENEREVNFLANNYSVEEIIENLELIYDNFEKKIPTPFLFKIFNKAPSLFFTHLLKMDLNTQSYNELQANPSLKKILNSRLNGLTLAENWAQKSKNKKKEISKPLRLIHEIDIFETLPTLFLKINFNQRQAPGYIDPLTLTNDGHSINLTQVYENLVQLLKKINNRTPYSGIPKGSETAFYKEIEEDLKTFAFYAHPIFENKIKSNDLALLTASRELIKIAIAGHHCGARWKRDAKEASTTLQEKDKLDQREDSIDSLIGSWLEDYLIGITEILMIDFKDLFENAVQPHLFNEFGIILENKLKTKFREGLFNTEDTLTDNLLEEEVKNCIKTIDKATQPFTLTRYVWLKLTEFIENETKKNQENYIAFQNDDLMNQEKDSSYSRSGDVVDLMRGVAEELCSDQIKELEKQLDEMAYYRGLHKLKSKLERAYRKTNSLSEKIEFYKKQLNEVDEKEEKVNSRQSKLKRKKDPNEDDELPREKRFKKEPTGELFVGEIKLTSASNNSLSNNSFGKVNEAQDNPKEVKFKEEQRVKINKKIKTTDKKYKKINENIRSLEEMIHNKSLHEEKIRTIGMESARNMLINEKQKLLDNYLEKADIFKVDEESLEMEISPYGAFEILRYLKFVETPE